MTEMCEKERNPRKLRPWLEKMIDRYFIQKISKFWGKKREKKGF